LARALAEFLFDNEKAMVRLDMSEFMEKHSVARLIGAPPGYVGYEEGGYLTEAVKRRPYAVILFDEIEKAHPDVFNILLQILDDGRLTDGKGRTVDFRNTAIIMTSNVGSSWIQELADKDRKEMERRVTEALRSTFKPEFLNRVDDIIIFNSLGRAEISRIIDIQLMKLQALLASKKIGLELTDQARELLFREGYDPTYGARPLKRALQHLIQDKLALRLLDGDLLPGDHVVADADWGKGELTFDKSAARQTVM
jgi:ATP-dependent Clp protease ATP-binding subunit ClpB